LHNALVNKPLKFTFDELQSIYRLRIKAEAFKRTFDKVPNLRIFFSNEHSRITEKDSNPNEKKNPFGYNIFKLF